MLPVELTSFQAFAKERTALLEWETAMELNNDRFVVERSADLRSFTAIGEVIGKGSTDSPSSYRFVDQFPLPGIHYYRLRQIDFDGTFSFSPIEAVDFGKEVASINIWPVPANDRIQVQLEDDPQLGSPSLIEIFDAKGQLIQTQQWVGPAQQSQDISQLPAGSYWLRLSRDSLVLGTGHFLKK